MPHLEARKRTAHLAISWRVVERALQVGVRLRQIAKLHM